jgi:hypothetical protein
VRDVQAGTTRQVSVSSKAIEGNKASQQASISADGLSVIRSPFRNDKVSRDCRRGTRENAQRYTP